MGKTRIVGLDLVKGIAIFMMCIVHAVTQVLADYDGNVFLSVRDRIPKFLLVAVVYPFVLIGLWGTVFTIITATTTSISSIHIIQKNRRAIWPYLFQRLVFLILLRLGECICAAVFDKSNDIFNTKMIKFPTIYIAGDATTLDSIGWSGIIAPLIVFLLFPVIVKRSLWVLITIFVTITAVVFAISPFSSFAFGWLANRCLEYDMGLLADIFGKIAFGRFKICQTAAFSVIGVLFGFLIDRGVSITFLMKLGIGFFLICASIFGIWIGIDSSFIDHIVDENVPLPAQILSLGCECALIFVHAWYVDGNRAVEKKLASRKRVTYLFRLAMLSLTIFCIGGWVSRQVALPWIMVFGPPCEHNPARLLWGVWICIPYVICVLIAWVLISIIWDKFDYKLSLEHIIGYCMSKMVGKEYTPNNRSLVYGPAEELEAEMRSLDISDAEKNTPLMSGSDKIIVSEEN